jgi:transcriptional regulator with XRE-family HTH domain
VQPEQAGLEREPDRRVTGLRRQEVARAAGISPAYYLRLEQGHDHQPSDQVLLALARALHLDHDATDYLVRIARQEPRGHDGSDRMPRADVLALLDPWSQTPAFVIDGNQDVVAANPLARALGGGRSTNEGANLVLSVFGPGVREITPDWESLALSTLASLRYTADPTDPRLHELVDTLSARDVAFRRMWARHDARPAAGGTSRTSIEGLGPVDLRYQSFLVPGGSGHVLVAFYDEPGTPASGAIAYLAARVGRDIRLARA